MKKRPNMAGLLVVASAIIWASVIIGSSSALSGTDCYNDIQYILAGGVLAHIFIVWGPLALFIKKSRDR